MNVSPMFSFFSGCPSNVPPCCRMESENRRHECECGVWCVGRNEMENRMLRVGLFRCERATSTERTHVVRTGEKRMISSEKRMLDLPPDCVCVCVFGFSLIFILSDARGKTQRNRFAIVEFSLASGDSCFHKNKSTHICANHIFEPTSIQF